MYMSNLNSNYDFVLPNTFLNWVTLLDIFFCQKIDDFALFKNKIFKMLNLRFYMLVFFLRRFSIGQYLVSG